MSDLELYLHQLRDPSGLPFYPWFFDFLLVLTFAAHILLVNLVLGGTVLLLWGRLSGSSYASRLSRSLSRALPISVSWAVVLGVAPLLFIQVLYDPFWYFSSVISAWWTLIFLAAIVLAFVSLYAYYLRGGYQENGNPWWIGLALVTLLLAALIIHALSIQALHPEKWSLWAIQGGGAFQKGTGLWGFHLPRILHFFSASLTITGIFLLLYARYFRDRSDYPEDYLLWVEKLGIRLALTFSLLQVLTGLWWLFSLPGEFHFYRHPLFLLGAGTGLLFLAVLFRSRHHPRRSLSLIGGLTFLTVFFMSYAREALRMKYLSRFGYSFQDYPLHISWGSTFLFLGTFLMGLVILSYVGLVAFRSGRGHREVGYERLGKLAVSLCWLWILSVVVLGLVISYRNGVLP